MLPGCSGRVYRRKAYETSYIDSGPASTSYFMSDRRMICCSLYSVLCLKAFLGELEFRAYQDRIYRFEWAI